MKRASAIVILALFSAAVTPAQHNSPAPAASASSTAGPRLYDPTRDPEQDVGQAVIQASWSGKRILVQVGGDWCSWCHKLEAFFDADPSLLKLRDNNFILVKVNFSPENENAAFLSRYPSIPGYPHIFILAPDGKFLHSEDTSLLEQGDTYSKAKLVDFLTEWSPR